LATLPLISCCAPLATPVLSDEEAEATAAFFRSLADPARVRIVNLLASSEEAVCVCELTAALGLALRAGYAFQRSPLPRAQTQTRFMDLDRHLLTAGVGATWLAPSAPFRSLELDLAVADALGVPRRTTTLAGPNADRASGHVLLLSASLVLSFGDTSP